MRCKNFVTLTREGDTLVLLASKELFCLAMSIAVVSPEDQKIKLENSWESQEPSDKQAPAQQLTTVINNNRSNDEGLHSSAQQDQQSHYSMSTDGVEMEPGFESCAEDDAENETDEAVYPAEDDAAMDETDAASTMHSLANSGILMSLDNDELWNKFSAAGTEMIITKSGRLLFSNAQPFCAMHVFRLINKLVEERSRLHVHYARIHTLQQFLYSDA